MTGVSLIHVLKNKLWKLKEEREIVDHIFTFSETNQILWNGRNTIIYFPLCSFNSYD